MRGCDSDFGSGAGIETAEKITGNQPSAGAKWTVEHRCILRRHPHPRIEGVILRPHPFPVSIRHASGLWRLSVVVDPAITSAKSLPQDANALRGMPADVPERLANPPHSFPLPPRDGQSPLPRDATARP